MLRNVIITLSFVLIFSAPAFAAQMTPEEQKKVDAVFDLTDSNSDKSLSKAEWEEASKAMYDIIDLDKDGKISIDEYRKSPESMRAKFEEGEKAKK